MMDGSAKREALRARKPLAAAKFDQYEAKHARGECIAQIQYEHRWECNLKCAHCAVTDLKDRTMLTIEQVRHLADEADAMGLGSWTITGGEPLVFPDLDELVAAIGAERFHIALDTNGWFLAENVDRLVKMGVDKVQVSLDSASGFQHDSLRGRKGSWARAVEGIRAAKDAGLAVIIASVVTDERVDTDEFKEFLGYAQWWEVPVFANLAKPVGEWAGQVKATQYTLDRVQEYRDAGYDVFHHVHAGYGLGDGRCAAGWRQFAIVAGGDVLACPWMRQVWGNVTTEPLAAIVARMMEVYGTRIEGCPAAEGRER